MRAETDRRFCGVADRRFVSHATSTQVADTPTRAAEDEVLQYSEDSGASQNSVPPLSTTAGIPQEVRLTTVFASPRCH